MAQAVTPDSSSPARFPSPLATLVGREREVAELRELVSTDRLVTLTGPPGVGKTCLAVEVASRLGAGVGRTSFVDLALVADPAHVAETMAAALGVPVSAELSALEALVAHLDADRRLLLMDNCEHVVGACAELVGALLDRCPGLRVLATSQEPLRVGGESLWRVPPLSLPEPDDQCLPEVYVHSEAVQLFCDRASTAERGFIPSADTAPAIADICRRLDGLPLAIELAAPLVTVLSPAEISARLDDRFPVLGAGARTAHPRHRSLAAAFAWSYSLLSGAEQTLLRRLSVLVGGWSLEAAHHVCTDEGMGAGDVLSLLSGLVGKSLVAADITQRQPRYRLLETIRHFAAAKLDDEAEATALRRRHAQWCLEMVEAAGDPRQVEAFVERLDPEGDNVAAALAWTVSNGQGELALRLVTAHMVLCRHRGRHREAREWLERVADLDAPAPASLRAKVLLDAGGVAAVVGDLSTAIARLRQSAAAYQSASEHRGAARALSILGFVSLLAEQADRGLEALDDGVAAARAADDDASLAEALDVSGRAHLLVGEVAVAEKQFSESLVVARRAAHPAALANALAGMGQSALVHGQYQAAASSLAAALDRSREVSDTHITAVTLAWLGELARLQGHGAEAQERFEECLELARAAHIPYPLGRALVGMGKLAMGKGQLPEARRRFDEALVAANEAHTPFVVSPSLLGLGEVSFALDELAAARNLLAEALAVARSAGDKLSQAGALFALGRLARSDGDHAKASSLQHQALQLRDEVGERAGMADSLEALAGLAAAGGKLTRATRLFGAAQAVRDACGVLRPAWLGTDYEADLAAVRNQLGSDELTEAWSEGQRLSAEEAVAYGSKGRGSRARPAEGWKALTDAEQDVVNLVSEGLTNRQIGERLFISPRTVQGQLRSVFAKLGVSSRSAVAREVSRRQPG